MSTILGITNEAVVIESSNTALSCTFCFITSPNNNSLYFMSTAEFNSLSLIYNFYIDLSNAFGLLVQWPEDPQEKLLVFRIESESTGSKTQTIQQLAKLMADVQFSTNSVSIDVHGWLSMTNNY